MSQSPERARCPHAQSWEPGMGGSVGAGVPNPSTVKRKGVHTGVRLWAWCQSRMRRALSREWERPREEVGDHAE